MPKPDAPQPDVPETGGDPSAQMRAQMPVANPDLARVLLSRLQAAGAHRVLDLGCGDGAVAAMLTEAGFDVTGIDPAPDPLARARTRAPRATFLQRGAEDLPKGLGPFDAACFVNSLHHIDQARMADALLGALAALRPGGIALVIEPLPEGSFFRAMRPIEDESEVRHAAMRQIERLISDGRIVLRDLLRWKRASHFANLGQFVDYLTRADPYRAELAERHAPQLARAWRENIRSCEGKAVLVQPMICWTLTLPRKKGTRP